MKKLFKLFIIAMLSVCSVACEQLGGVENGNNLNGGNGNDDSNGNGNGNGGTTATYVIEVSNITATGATVSVTPSTTDTYYFDVVEKDYLDGYVSEAQFIADYVADLKSMINENNSSYGTNYSIVDILSSGSDSYTYEDGDLEPNNDYYAFVFGLSESGEITSGITKKVFKTLNEATTSNNAFQISVSNITATGATVSVTPSTTDTYYFDVVEKEILDYYTDKKDFAAEYIAELKAYIAEEFGYTLDMILSSGSDAYAYEDSLEPNTDYYAFAVGMSSNGAITTDVKAVSFTTLASGDDSGNTGGGDSDSGDKNLTCFEMGYYENWGDYYETNALNWYIDLYSSTTNDYFVLELQGDLSETAPVAGEYQLLSTFAVGTAVAGGIDADGYGYGTYWGLFDDSWENFVDFSLCTSGTVKVGKSGDLYTIDIDALDENGNSIKLSYAGVLEEYISDYALSAQKLSNNLNKRFCTVSRMMKQKQIKMAPKAAKKVVTLAPKKVFAPAKKVVAAPKSVMVKRNFVR